MTGKPVSKEIELQMAEMQLIRKLRSPDNKYVVQAVEELRARGWLSLGVLEGAGLRHARMQGADLYKANLRKADLRMANLWGADLSKADLQGARLNRANLRRADLSRTNLQDADLFKVNLQGARNLTEAQLAQARRLCGATMPDSSPYDGRYNLAGDIAFAQAGHVDTGNPAAMANFYGVSLEEYLRGQEWELELERPDLPFGIPVIGVTHELRGGDAGGVNVTHAP